MRLFDLRHPFFRPLWRRLLTTAVCLGWAAVELARGAPVWAMVFGAMGALCLWEFFVVYDPENYRDREKDG